MNKPFYELPADLGEDIDRHELDVQRYLDGDLSPAIFKARRVPRGVYEQRQEGTYMVRVRVAAGALTADQTGLLAETSRTYGNGVLHLTTRQDVQLHDVDIRDTAAVMRRLHDVGLSSKGGGGNTVRNVMACPYAHICEQELFDVTPYAHAVTEYLIKLPGSYTLPRKYKIAFSGCAADCGLCGVADLGFVATARNGQPGFRLLSGGGMGARSRAGELLHEFLPGSQVIQAAEAIRRLFDRMGDRKKRAKARLRFVVERIGMAAFSDLFVRELAEVRAEGIPEAGVTTVINGGSSPDTPPREPTFEMVDGIRILRQKQTGLIAVPVFPALGNISAADFAQLGRLAAEFSNECGFRVTRNQNAVLRSVPEEKLSDLTRELRKLSSDIFTPTPLHAFTACTGSSMCRLGLCLSTNLSTACADALAAADLPPELFSSMDIRISGCPNSCGQHPIAPVGLFGTATRVDGRLVPSYQVVVGGRCRGEDTRLGVPVGRLPARAVPEFILDFVREFAKVHAEGETFAGYIDRVGAESVTRLIECQTVDLKNGHWRVVVKRTR